MCVCNHSLLSNTKPEYNLFIHTLLADDELISYTYNIICTFIQWISFIPFVHYVAVNRCISIVWYLFSLSIARSVFLLVSTQRLEVINMCVCLYDANWLSKYCNLIICPVSEIVSLCLKWWNWPHINSISPLNIVGTQNKFVFICAFLVMCLLGWAQSDLIQRY